MGRIAVFALPIFAVVIGLGQFSRVRFSADPVAYAHYLATGRHTWVALATTFGVGFFGIVALVGLTLLLIGAGIRRLAVIGCALGVAGAICMLLAVGTLVVRVPRMAGPLAHGRLDDVVINAQTRGAGAATPIVLGALLLTIGWILLAIGVFRTRGLNQGDGGLLAFSAPLVYLGGMFGATLPTIGAFMLGAAGLGIVGNAGRIGAVTGPLTMSSRTRVRAGKHSASPFAAFTDGDGSLDELEGLTDEEIAARYGDEVDVDLSGDGPQEIPAAAASAAPASDDLASDDPVVTTGLVTTHGGAPNHGVHGERRSGVSRLPRGKSTAWPVTRNAPAAAGAPPKPPAGDAAAAVGADGAATPSSSPNRGSGNTAGRPDDKAANAKQPSSTGRGKGSAANTGSKSKAKTRRDNADGPNGSA